jgi:carbon storage regulator
MLVLERELGQKIIIGDDVIIEVVNHNGCQIKFGVNAPRSIPVYRSEIHSKIKSNQKKHHDILIDID